MLYTFSFLMARLVEGDLESRWVRRRRERMLDELTDHFIICGFGRMGFIIAQEFMRQKVPFVVIERNPERMQQAIEAGFLAVEADASSEQVLKRVRIEHARGFIAAVSTDAENVYAVLTARLLRPDLYIIGRAETEDARAKLVRAGADRVVSPYQIGGLQLAQTALRPAVVDFVQIATSSENLELNMEQVQIHEGAALAGRSIVDANLRQRFGVVVVGIQRADGRMEFNPPPDAAMRAGDHLVVLGHPDKLRELEAAAGHRRHAPFGEPHGRAHSRRRLGRSGAERVGAAGRAAVHGAAGPAARPRHRARRRRSRLGDLRPQQGARRAASPGSGSICSGCPRRRRSTSCSAPSTG